MYKSRFGNTSLGYGTFNTCINLEKIYCKVEDPNYPNLNCYGSAFDYDTYSKATLYVPMGSVVKYKEVYPWINFINIQEFDQSGVEEITQDAEIDFTVPYDIYNLRGIKMSETIDNLPMGIYIIRQGNKVIMIAVI